MLRVLPAVKTTGFSNKRLIEWGINRGDLPDPQHPLANDPFFTVRGRGRGRARQGLRGGEACSQARHGVLWCSRSDGARPQSLIVRVSCWRLLRVLLRRAQIGKDPMYPNDPEKNLAHLKLLQVRFPWLCQVLSWP